MSRPSNVPEVIARMRAIDAELEPSDGVAIFNRMYLRVTELIEQVITGGSALPLSFDDPATMADLDVRFAGLWLEAYDADVLGRSVPTPWRPLFEARAGRRWPIQYALAGMNTHIEHDLPVAVVETCRARGLEPDDLRADYEAVNAMLAQVEAPIRRSFLTEVGQGIDEHAGPVVHVISAWNIDKARDLSWITTQTIWSLRRVGFLQERFLDAVGDTVAMTSRTLLLPTR